MPPGPPPEKSHTPPAPLWVVAFLQVLAVVTMLLTIVAVGVQVLAHLRQDLPLTPVDVVMLIAGFVLGLSIGACLFGIAALIGHQVRTARALQQVESILTDELARLQAPAAAIATMPSHRPVSSSSATTTGLDAKAINSLLTLLGEIRDNSLLTDPQRKERFTRLMVQHRKTQIAKFEALLEQRQFHPADEVLAQLTDRFGTDQEFSVLADRLDQARRRVQAEELTTAQSRVDEFLKSNAHHRAEQVAAELAQRHPDLKTAQELLQSVRQQKNAFQTQHRAGLLDQIQQDIQRREWAAALQSAKLLMSSYPDSPEAGTIRQQMEILEINAEVAHRQVLEARITELVKRHEYSAAIEIAEHVLTVYPASPQAEVLRGQLPRLRGLAADLGWGQAGSTA